MTAMSMQKNARGIVGMSVVRGRGYTMLELLVTMGIVGILAMMAAPSFQESLRRNAREAAMLELTSALSLTRSEAVLRAVNVSICRSVNQTACAASTGGDWDDGWIVFSDTGTAGVVDGTDVLVQARVTGNALTSIELFTRANGNFTGDFLQFNEDGFLENSTTGAYYKFCDPDNVQANTRAVHVSNTGRPASSMDDGDGIHNDLEGVNLTCP